MIMDHLLKRGLKLSHLRLMAAIAASGQIGTAARDLGITQPAASRLLAETEAIIGQPMHLRAGRGVALTPAGPALARRAGRIMLEINEAARDIGEVSDGSSGHVRIGSVTGPAMDRVLPALRAARLALPGVTVEVDVATSDLLGEQLLAGRIDFALARLPDGHDPALFDIRILGDEPVCLVVRRGHRLAQEPTLNPGMLMDYDWVLPGPGTILRRAVLARLSDLGLREPPGRLATSSFLLTLAMLQQSNAIAPLANAVAASFAQTADAAYAVLPIDLGIRVAPYGLITRAASRLTPAAERIRALIAS